MQEQLVQTDLFSKKLTINLGEFAFTDFLFF